MVLGLGDVPGAIQDAPAPIQPEDGGANPRVGLQAAVEGPRGLPRDLVVVLDVRHELAIGAGHSVYVEVEGDDDLCSSVETVAARAAQERGGEAGGVGLEALFEGGEGVASVEIAAGAHAGVEPLVDTERGAGRADVEAALEVRFHFGREDDRDARDHDREGLEPLGQEPHRR